MYRRNLTAQFIAGGALFVQLARAFNEGHSMSGLELGSLYTTEELRQMLGSVGENVAVNRSVVFYSPKNIHVGSNSRIDCFSILSASSAGIVIGDHVHVSAYVGLFGASGKNYCRIFLRSIFACYGFYFHGRLRGRVYEQPHGAAGIPQGADGRCSVQETRFDRLRQRDHAWCDDRAWRLSGRAQFCK